MKHTAVVGALFAIASHAQVSPDSPLPLSSKIDVAWRLDRVVHDAPGDGRLWACGTNWKASFGRDGFTFVPFLAGAERNLPIAFRIARVVVGGRGLAIDGAATPRRDGDRVTFDRGDVHEVYDLSLQHVEQSFVVDTGFAGDIVLELEIATELREDPTRPGLQFACAHGEVDYGAAFVVRDGEKTAITTEWRGGLLRMHVPAALRGDGPVVIDPILSTQTAGSTGTYVRVDAAYDVTNDRHMVVFESVWTVTDHDIWTVMFDGAGNLLPGSGLAVDFTTTNWVYPRTANLNHADRFLITATVDDPNIGRQMIYSRTRDAQAAVVGAPQLLSDPTLFGDNQAAEVGADPATGPGNHDWLVVWTNRTSPTSRIQGRLVTGSGLPRSANVVPVQGGNDTVDGVQVSRSNGNGHVPHPRWCVVYTRQAGAWRHVVGRTVDPDGNVGNEVPFDDSSNTNGDPKVSSPIADGTKSLFLIVYTRNSTTVRGISAAFTATWSGSTYHDLTAVADLRPGTLDIDSDGARFVVTSPAMFAGQVDVSLLGWELGGITRLGFAQTLPSGFAGFADAQVAAHRSSGGAVGRYSIGYLQGVGSSRTAALLRYGGYTTGPTSNVLATACVGSSLVLAMTGEPYLGSAVTFTLSGHGNAFPLICLGGANASAVPICPDCWLGLRADLPIHPFGGTSASLFLPPVTSLVGETFAMQGLTIGTHPCLGGIEASDTIRWTIR